MEHGDQIVSLINYAEARNGYPLYLLYNYLDDIPIQPADFELYGCSITDAYYLRDNYYNVRTIRKPDGTSKLKWDIPSFSDLHPSNAFPWHELVCDTSPEKIITLLSSIMDIGNKRDLYID